MRNNRYALAISGLLLTGTGAAFGQVTPPATGTPPAPATPAPPPTPAAPAKSVPYGAGMKVNLSPDGSKYLRFIGWTQAWAQYTQNNSNTLRNGVPTDDQLTFNLRRTRLITLAQLNPRFLLIIDVGMENQNSVSGEAPLDATGPGKRPQVYMHEAVGEYRINKYLNLGGGLHYQNGISRMTSASTLNMLTLDVPVVNFPTLDQTDQFGYFLGFYAKGRIGSFDYRLAVDDAFLTNQASNPSTLRTNVAQFYPRNSNKIYQGYFSYSFLDKEANLLPFFTGTYLGTKRVLNIGAGFHYNPSGTYSRPSANPTTIPANTFTIPYNTHDIKLFGADVFYDAPLDTASNTALTAYAVYYNYNFGPNYVRNAGVLNPGTGVSTGQAGLTGNALPLIGTGQSYYAQLGLLLPKNLLGPKAKLQPYVAYLHNSLNGLLDTDGSIRGVNVYDAGLNLLLDGHNAKITLNYRFRPDFSDQTNNADGTIRVNSVQYRPEITLQTQVYL
ncbi:hypothetical protein GKZ68_06185 [Hymenobacter sp. BRD128]|uniref:hypothetical protein n=1 Tax=Hymenobacter sp. BRD128 TaxID=2675878 RepID=UPI001565F430|nr:hypothetical protein [Hymenobacter sp. BRD128]QKG56265.1 hypothetical protein GKZ68_06185 [Hymenobacter sp. BRD128]